MKKKVFLSLLITGVIIATTIGVVLAKPWTGISTTPTSNAIIGGNALGYTQPAYYAVAKSGIELSNGHTIPSGARFVIYKTATTNRYAALYGTESLSYFTSSSVTSDSRFQITSEYTDGGRRLTDGVVPNEYMIALAKMNAQSIEQCEKFNNYEKEEDYIDFVFCATLGENGPLLTYNEETKTGNWTSSDLPYIHGDCVGYAFDNSGNPIYCLDNGTMRKCSNGTTVSGSYDIWPDNLDFTKTAGTVYVDNGDGTGYFYAMSCSSLASTSIKQRYRTIGFTISLDTYPNAAETEQTKAALTWDEAPDLYTQLGLSDSAIIYEIPFTDTDGDKHRTDNPSITIFSVSLDDVITAVYAKSDFYLEQGNEAMAEQYSEWGDNLLKRQEEQQIYCSSIYSTRYVFDGLEYNTGGVSSLGSELYNYASNTAVDTNSESSYNNKELGGIGIYGTTTYSAHNPTSVGNFSYSKFTSTAGAQMSSAMNNPISIPSYIAEVTKTSTESNKNFATSTKYSASIVSDNFNVENAIPTTESIQMSYMAAPYLLLGKQITKNIKAEYEPREMIIYYYKDAITGHISAVSRRVVGSASYEGTVIKVDNYSVYTFDSIEGTNTLLTNKKDTLTSTEQNNLIKNITFTQQMSEPLSTYVDKMDEIITEYATEGSNYTHELARTLSVARSSSGISKSTATSNLSSEISKRGKGSSNPFIVYKKLEESFTYKKDTLSVKVGSTTYDISTLSGDTAKTFLADLFQYERIEQSLASSVIAEGTENGTYASSATYVYKKVSGFNNESEAATKTYSGTLNSVVVCKEQSDMYNKEPEYA